MKTEPSLAPLLQAYFSERLIAQRNASPNTIASHRDTFRLLLQFGQKSLKKAPTDLAITDLDAPFIGRFLDHVEKDRGNTPQTRNVRLAAIHSFFHYLALQEPGVGALAQRVLAIPGKRHKTKPVDFLTRAEIEALLAAPDQSTWAGRRDRTLLLVAVRMLRATPELSAPAGRATGQERGQNLPLPGGHGTTPLRQIRRSPADQDLVKGQRAGRRR